MVVSDLNRLMLGAPPSIPKQQQRQQQANNNRPTTMAERIRQVFNEVAIVIDKSGAGGGGNGKNNNNMNWITAAMLAEKEKGNKYRQTRYSSRRIRKRVIFKQGDCNVIQGNMAKRRRRYLQDIFTTMVDIQWRWTLLVFALSFILSWLGFGIIWYLIAYSHGDMQAYEMGDNEHKPCVTFIYGFTSAFLFSLETQHTIGYGNRFVTEECPEAVFILSLQSITGVFIQSFMVGLVFAKLSRPKKRAQTLLFSRNAVICHRDGMPCLMFRVGDMRKSHIIEAHVTAQIIRRKVTKEGEVLPFYQQNMEVSCDGGDDRLMFIWPTIVVHKIDKESPLYNLSAQDILRERFEIVVMLEGVVESTGMTTQARSSYLPSEILWGHRFESVVSFKRDTGEYEVDYTTFNNTYEVDTPLCSARQLNAVKKELNKQSGLGSSSSSSNSECSSSSEEPPSPRIRKQANSAQQLPNGYLHFDVNQVQTPDAYSSNNAGVTFANDLKSSMKTNNNSDSYGGGGSGGSVGDVSDSTTGPGGSPSKQRQRDFRKLTIKEPSMDSLC
ncbi:G protein-activated inward rectifier potassium channel 3-like isoform X2 [Uranotaenia lowii]|uniref:G protein-activated inward rectifier potassium channel 3-like isoform X2 n=1 Tax=Uranotaenia lowii TaxID=190385 RepID=UPI00247914B2|nr:G protein-activated inward rectifier potassium channel 3-like isoform X2 [Uranotaenia lowii]